MGVHCEFAARFIASIESDRLQARYVAATATGLRRGELLGLFWSDLDLDKRQLTVRRELVCRPGEAYEFDAPKTARSRRVVPLPVMAIDALRAHETRQKRERLAARTSWQGDAKAQLVFATATGLPLAGGIVTHALARHLNRANLPHQRLHGLRHGYASILLAEGVSVRPIQELLGHTTMATTSDVYTHIARPHSRLRTPLIERWNGHEGPLDKAVAVSVVVRIRICPRPCV